MPIDSGRGAPRARRLGPLEAAIVFAVFGGFLAVTIPTFARDVRASRFVEPVEGLQRLGQCALAFGQAHAVAHAFPPSAPLTPPKPARGRCEADPPEIWEHPTWKALEFLPAPMGTPHCFSFAFDSALSPTRSTFRADAHGDLDGDGLTSTFEISGHYVDGDAQGPVLDPGMFIDSEVE